LVSQVYAQTALSLTATQSLAFGSIIRFPTAGSITLSAQGSVSASNVMYVRGSVRHVALFSVTGDANRNFYITLPVSTTLSGPDSATMTLDTFTVLPSSPASLGVDGTCSFAVGATLEVAMNQPTGEYSGTFEVLISYE